MPSLRAKNAEGEGSGGRGEEGVAGCDTVSRTGVVKGFVLRWS